MKWSYSSIKLFEQCARKYLHLRVLKDVVEPESEAMLYGTRFHKAAEDYIKDGAPLLPEFSYAKSTLDALLRFSGTRYCEYEMGVTENLDPCAFDAPDVWYRGIADLLIIDEAAGEARVLDYKTGSSAKYADPDQLELMSLCVFKHFPAVKKVRAGLLFVVAKKFVKANFDSSQQDALWGRWVQKHHRLQASFDHDVWNPKPSGLCRKHCSVLTCSHNGRA
jgi:hypothetical protein